MKHRCTLYALLTVLALGCQSDSGQHQATTPARAGSPASSAASPSSTTAEKLPEEEVSPVASPAPAAGDPLASAPTSQSEPAPAADPEYDKLDAEMKEEARKGYYGAALRHCNKAYQRRPGSRLATQCGVLACRVRNGKAAGRFRDQADDQGKKMIHQVCLTIGIDLTR